jgi:RNA polymerase sigma factor (sigma-70 family)
LENSIWLNIESGDKEAYSEAYVFYYKRLFNYGKKITEDIAMIEDAIDEVFIMIWLKRADIHTINSPQAYIFSSFRNNLRRKVKSLKKTVFSNIEDDSKIEFSIDSIIIQRETDGSLKVKLQQAIEQLTSRQREAIFLRFYEGLSYPEIAVIMHISVKATYKIMSRALNELKEILSIPTALLLLLLKQLF